MDKFTSKEVEQLNKLRYYAKEMNLGEKLNSLIPSMDTPVNAVKASETLTFTGVVEHGETLTIGEDVYQLAADVDGLVVDAGNIPVDIFAGTTQSTGTLTVDVQPIAGDTMTIAGKVYTFVPDGTANADGEISIGVDLAEAQANIVDAINGDDGFNIANDSVSISDFTTNEAVLTALIGGTVGDSIDTTETFTAETNIFAADVLSGGANCSAADAITALAATISNDISATDGTGDTLVIESDIGGVLGNSIDVSTDIANASLGDTHLSGGIDGTPGLEGERMIDADYYYVCLADNDISGANWRRTALETF
jgi:hypothetical protein